MRHHTFLVLTAIAICVCLPTTSTQAQQVPTCQNPGACPISLGYRPGDPTYYFQDSLLTIDNVHGDFQGQEPGIAVSVDGKWLIGFESVDQSAGGVDGNDIFVHRFCDSGQLLFETGDDCPLRLTVAADGADHGHVSVALNDDATSVSRFTASWASAPVGQSPDLSHLDSNYMGLEILNWTQAGFGVGVLPIPTPLGGNMDIGPSAGTAGGIDVFGVANMFRPTAPPYPERGLMYERHFGSQQDPVDRLRCYNDASNCPLETSPTQVTTWQPTVVSRDDASYVVVWSEKERAGFPDSPFNIALRVYDDTGALKIQLDRDTGTWVNEPDREIPDLNQLSPAVDFDSCGNIVVTWVGPAPAGSSSGPLAVYARRLFYDDTVSPSTLSFLSSQFVVNSSPSTTSLWDLGADPDLVNPAVALIKTEYDQSEDALFWIAWNSSLTDPGNPSISQRGVRGQMFSPAGLTVGKEFDVTPNPDEAPYFEEPSQAITFDGIDRTLAESAQHTIAYQAKMFQLATWTARDQATDDRDVWYTLISPLYYMNQNPISHGDSCMKGDTDMDADVDIDDVPSFVATLLGDTDAMSIIQICPADMNSDGLANGDDIQCFTDTLIAGGTLACEPVIGTCPGSQQQQGGGGGGEGAAPGGGSQPAQAEQSAAAAAIPSSVGVSTLIPDCNSNANHDANDIAAGVEADCNHNFIPDACDIADATSADLNGNGTPDECEPDCNGNAVPDDKDIADAVSNDVNGNMVPDECEPDCNANGLPDAWELTQGQSLDLNANGTPDECEEDSNSNGIPDDVDIALGILADCNGNAIPDSVDMARRLLPSFDCNNNGIPDECDIASGTAQDANGNGYPDACDAAANVQPSEVSREGSQEAWAEYFEWSLSAAREPSVGHTGSEWFGRMIAKRRALGLPLSNPWAMVLLSE